MSATTVPAGGEASIRPGAVKSAYWRLQSTLSPSQTVPDTERQRAQEREREMRTE